MKHFQEKQQKYTKWDQTIWNSIEKQISLFQKKVTDCMQSLGDFNKRSQKDFKIEPTLEGDVILGEEFYLEMIRPLCAMKDYLPKKPVSPQQVADVTFAEEIERQKNLVIPIEKKEKDKKPGGKKGGGGGKKGANTNNVQKMEVKIVKDNLQKQIDIVLKSHSMNTMQVSFGLKQKKLQLKLITFFYVAYYIRKNKVDQKIDESEIFELINILIKMVRIFSHLQGPSFLDTSKMMQVSPTLILDLKMCIKQLKDYYNYANKTIIIKYPKLVYYTNYDKYFPTLDIKPYPSQIEFIQAVKSSFNEMGNLSKPTVIFYRTMIGSGKTSASLALSQLVNECKLVDSAKNSNLQVVYSCLIGSVRIQVGRYCYNKKQKFALAAMERSVKDQTYLYPRIINSWSCKNQKVVDIIITDPYTTYEMLDKHHLNAHQKDVMEHQTTKGIRKSKVVRGKLDKENVVLFIDEPTAFCKSTQSKASRKVFEILANYPPKLTIFASATMPGKQQLSKTIKLLKKKNPDLNVIQVDSREFQIGCQYCSFKGQVIFPHTGVKNKTQLQRIYDILHKNAFLLKLYTGPSLFFLLKKCEEVGIKGLPKIDELPEVRQQDITRATFKILENLLNQKDSMIEQVCSIAKDETIMDFKYEAKKKEEDEMFDFMEDEEEEQQEKETQKQDYVNFKRMLKGDAHKFLGGCLIGAANPLEFAKGMFERWVRKIKPIKRLIEKYNKEIEELNKQIRSLEQDTEMREQKKTQKISKLQSDKEPKLDFPENRRINTSDHYNKYCKNKQASHLSMLIKPVPIESDNILDLIDEEEDFIIKLLFCGVAVYCTEGLSSKYLDKVEELASANFLSYIITDQSLCYGTNFPISNVILTDGLIEKLNMNEMFQLIGRAGRVGQSWTARAFLEEKGLKKLNDYIHVSENQKNDEGRIFEQIAQQNLNYPLLRLRNLMCEVRYLDNIQNSQQIQIEIKKKTEDSHIIKNVTLVPYIKTPQNTLKYLCNSPYPTLKYNHFPTTPLYYTDIPTVKNAQNYQVIDVESFYVSFKDFVYKITDKAIQRLFNDDLKGKLKNYKIVNHLKPKVYEPFYNAESNNLAILIECQEADEVIGEFKFQTLMKNTIGNADDIIYERILESIRKSQAMGEVFRQNPLNVPFLELKGLIENYKQICEMEKGKGYKEMIQYNIKICQTDVTEGLQKLSDKTLFENEKEMVIALAIERCSDLKMYFNENFHVHQNIRSIWKNIENKSKEFIQ